MKPAARNNRVAAKEGGAEKRSNHISAFWSDHTKSPLIVKIKSLQIWKGESRRFSSAK